MHLMSSWSKLHANAPFVRAPRLANVCTHVTALNHYRDWRRSISPLTTSVERYVHRGVAEPAVNDDQLAVLIHVRVVKSTQVNLCLSELIVGCQDVESINAQGRVLIEHRHAQRVRCRGFKTFKYELFVPLGVGATFLLHGGLHRPSDGVAVVVHYAALHVGVTSPGEGPVGVLQVCGVLHQHLQSVGHRAWRQRFSASR
mmetsp:Transcript_16362/g.13193  ORF Transcript_16362/g.13193 Transcript_16362/m.13193 type:complete len:200 (-) Transcript_16362:92-691(-)